MDSKNSPSPAAGQQTPLGKVLFGGQASAVKFQRGRNISFNAGQTQKAPDLLSFRVALDDGKAQTVEMKGIVVRGDVNDGDVIGVIDGKQNGDVYRAKKAWNLTKGSAITATLLGALRRRS